jgi:hypothetical protein
MAPLCVNGCAFPPVEGTPAAIRRWDKAAGTGRGMAREAGGGGRSVGLAGPGSGLSEVPVWGCEPVALESVVVPRCRPGPVIAPLVASSSMRR